MYAYRVLDDDGVQIVLAPSFEDAIKAWRNIAVEELEAPPDTQPSSVELIENESIVFSLSVMQMLCSPRYDSHIFYGTHWWAEREAQPDYQRKSFERDRRRAIELHTEEKIDASTRDWILSLIGSVEQLLRNDSERRATWVAELNSEVDKVSAEAHQALAFATSTIKSGEPWTEKCEEVIGGVLRKLGVARKVV